MSRQEGKVFIGGLSWETTDEKLKRYFENYGTVQEAFVSYDRHTGRPRGFGFVVFADPVIADKVVAQQHTIDRREVEAKRALPKEESPVSKDQQAAASGQRTKKIFVGGLAATVDEAAFREYFEEFGGVEDAVVMYDHENKRPRGFGFITFAEEESVDKVFAKGTIQTIHEKQIEVKRAVPRDAMPPSPRTLFRPPPHGSPYNERSPYRHGPPGYPYRGRNDGYSPQPDYAGRPVDGGRGDLDPRPLYTPPAVVTGIPASIAAAPAVPAGDPSAPPTGGVMPAMPAMSGGGMVGMAPPIAMSPVGLQSPPQHLVTGGFALQNGMQGGGGAQLGAVVGSPPFGIEPQQPPAPANLADVQQQLSLTTVSDALEQLQQQQQQQQQQTQAAQQQQAAQTTIWS